MTQIVDRDISIAVAIQPAILPHASMYFDATCSGGRRGSLQENLANYMVRQRINGRAYTATNERVDAGENGTRPRQRGGAASRFLMDYGRHSSGPRP